MPCDPGLIELCCEDCDCGSVLVTGAAHIYGFSACAPVASYSVNCATDDDCQFAFYDNLSQAVDIGDGNSRKRYLQREVDVVSYQNNADGSTHAFANFHTIERYDKCGLLRYKYQYVKDSVTYPGGNTYEKTVAADGTVTVTGTEAVLPSVTTGRSTVCVALGNGGTGTWGVTITEDGYTATTSGDMLGYLGLGAFYAKVVDTRTMAHGLDEALAEAQQLADLIDLTNLDKIYTSDTFPDLGEDTFQVSIHDRIIIKWACPSPGTEEHRYPIFSLSKPVLAYLNGKTFEAVCTEDSDELHPLVPGIQIFRYLDSEGQAVWSKALVNGETGDPTGYGVNSSCWFDYEYVPGHPATINCPTSDSAAGYLSSTINQCVQWLSDPGPCSTIITPDTLLGTPYGIGYLCRRCEVVMACEAGLILSVGPCDICCEEV